MPRRGFSWVSRAKPRFSGPEVLRTRDLEGSGAFNSPVFENGAPSKWKIGLFLEFWGGAGSRPLGNPHALVPARASARRLGRHHFGVGTWGLRRRSLRKPRESPRPRGRRLTASRTRTWGSGGRNSPNALALMRFEHQIP